MYYRIISIIVVYQYISAVTDSEVTLLPIMWVDLVAHTTSPMHQHNPVNNSVSTPQIKLCQTCQKLTLLWTSIHTSSSSFL